MKKALIIAAVAGLSMVSCQKEYTCECAVTYGGKTNTSEVTATMKKKDSKTWCENQKGSSPGYSYECNLK